MLALVTGASRGIGAATARKLAADGYEVLVHYNRAQSEAERIAAEIHGTALCADLADAAQTAELAEEIRARFGTPDLLVNNAGVSVTGLFQEIPEAEALRLFAVNLGAAMRLTKAFLPGMIARHSGVVINVASVWGEAGAACEVHYSASKAALIGFTKALAKETGPSGIRVCCVSPGVIDTEMNAGHTPGTLAALAEETPLQRIGTPEEVAEAIAFLASDRARFITGTVLPVGGGFGT